MYCTIQNIKELVPENLLTELTSGNDDFIAKAITSAEATIKVYLAGSYDLSKTADNAFLQCIAERISVYNLYIMSAFDETPQVVVTSYLEAISDLGKIQTGQISLTANEASNERTAEIYTNKKSYDKLFSNLRGY